MTVIVIHYNTQYLMYDIHSDAAVCVILKLKLDTQKHAHNYRNSNAMYCCLNHYTAVNDQCMQSHTAINCGLRPLY